MIRLNLVIFLFCIIFIGCNIEPRELLKSKSYFIPEISLDTINVAGDDLIRERIMKEKRILKVYNLDEIEIKDYEYLMESEVILVDNKKERPFICFFNCEIIKDYKRYYLLYKRNDGKTILRIFFKNPNKKKLEIEFQDDAYRETIPPNIEYWDSLGMIEIEFELKERNFFQKIFCKR